MPLPPPVAREELHLRRIELRGYRRHDALYEIDARITDTKSQPLKLERDRLLAPGEPLHDMWIRMVIDEDLLVHDVIAVTDASPFGICGEAVDSLAQLKGMRIGAGWTAAVKQKLAGAVGCTHLTELLIPLGTTAFQTLSPVRMARPVTLNAQGTTRQDRQLLRVWQQARSRHAPLARALRRPASYRRRSKQIE